jgi:hypothetical protein
MTHARISLFAISFLFFLAFAGGILAMCYLAVPPLEALVRELLRAGAYNSGQPADVVRAMLGHADKQVFGLTALVLLCATSAAMVTARYARREELNLQLRDQLFVAYGIKQDAQRETAQMKQLLANASAQIAGLADQLRKLQSATHPTALNANDYDTADAPENPALRALQNVSDELEQASESVREMVPSAHSLEHSLSPLAVRARAAAESLTALQKIVTRLNRLAINAALEAARLGTQSQSFANLAQEFKLLSRATAEQAASIGEQVWHLKEILSAASSPLSAIVTDAETTLSHLNEAAELIDLQWGRLARPSQDTALAHEVAQAARQAESLGHKMRRALEEREAA